MHPDYLLIGWLVGYSIALFLEIVSLKDQTFAHCAYNWRRHAGSRYVARVVFAAKY